MDLLPCDERKVKIFLLLILFCIILKSRPPKLVGPGHVPTLPIRKDGTAPSIEVPARGPRQNFSMKLTPKKLEGWGYCMVKTAWS